MDRYWLHALVLACAPAVAADAPQQLSLRSPVPQAARCIVQQAQNSQHYTKTTDPKPGQQQIVVYSGATPSETRELATILIAADGRGSRASISSPDASASGDVIAR